MFGVTRWVLIINTIDRFSCTSTYNCRGCNSFQFVSRWPSIMETHFCRFLCVNEKRWIIITDICISGACLFLARYRIAHYTRSCVPTSFNFSFVFSTTLTWWSPGRSCARCIFITPRERFFTRFLSGNLPPVIPRTSNETHRCSNLLFSVIVAAIMAVKSLSRILILVGEYRQRIFRS